MLWKDVYDKMAGDYLLIGNNRNDMALNTDSFISTSKVDVLDSYVQRGKTN